MKVRHIAIAGLTTLAVAAIGCASSDDDGDEASATTTSALQAQSQDGVLEGVVDAEDDAAPEPEVAAQKVVDYPARGLSPEGCAKKVRDGNVVTLTLDDPPPAAIAVEPELRVKLQGEVGTKLAVRSVSLFITMFSGEADPAMVPDQDWNCAPGIPVGVRARGVPGLYQPFADGMDRLTVPDPGGDTLRVSL